ncbi:uncharacterized protein LOC110831000 isoform X2 [Zootermopsis nevadensis]|nr:uncharacterized protein LOC110831000 isoform X2 [Zootermopsis nevadensis]XP_021922185.1 uncharacterized protein LOC110831000 isoform X2 [Zootermopsis nevadensis]
MGLHEREKQLTFLYSAGGCLSLITIICSAVPWNHWEEILDRCLSVNCGCILFGKQTFNSFDGGDISVCYFITLASVPAFIIAVIMAVYHGYRVSMFSKEADNTTGRKTRRHRKGVVIVMTERSRRVAEDPGCICWTGLVILACCISILLIINAGILIYGYYKTCGEYRTSLSKDSQITGQMAAAINGRLSCGAIFDFMDYLEPVTRPFQRKEYVNYNRPHEEKDFERGPFINTGLSLQTAVGSACINCVVWITIFVNNGILVYNSRGWCGSRR